MILLYLVTLRGIFYYLLIKNSACFFKFASVSLSYLRSTSSGYFTHKKITLKTETKKKTKKTIQVNFAIDIVDLLLITVYFVIFCTYLYWCDGFTAYVLNKMYENILLS